jgi:glutamate synthase (NADPH) large chain
MREHDWVRRQLRGDLKGRRSHANRRSRPSTPCATRAPWRPRRRPRTGDGAGILIQVPDASTGRSSTSSCPLKARMRPASRSCPRTAIRPIGEGTTSSAIVADEGLEVLGWRDVPVDAIHPRHGGARDDAHLQTGLPRRRRAQPAWHSTAGPTSPASASNTRSASRPARRGQRSHGRPASEAHDGVYFPSLSCRTGRLQGDAHPPSSAFYPDLVDERVESALALVHSRFSTNTFPSWPSPTRTVSSPTTARSTPSRATATGCGPAKHCCVTELIPGDLERIFPICTRERPTPPGFDEASSSWYLGGYSLRRPCS